MTELRSAAEASAVHGFRVDPADSTPPYQQLRACVIEAIRAGSLLPGQQLPTVRALADAAGLAINTVAHAYRSLDEDGVLEGRGRAGTFVTPGASGDEEGRRAAIEFAARARRLGLDEERALALVRDALRAVHPG